jgi:hypothetical protein
LTPINSVFQEKIKVNTYMVSYDLIKRKDYPELWAALNAFSPKLHLLGSTWIIKSTMTAYDICVALLKHVDGDDKIIVSQLAPGGSVWSMSFPETFRTWLTNNGL